MAMLIVYDFISRTAHRWHVISSSRHSASSHTLAAGQAILCTVHQPSVRSFTFFVSVRSYDVQAMLFQRFDRLLFLAKGGKTIYFGEIGENSRTLVQYMERNGAEKFPTDENPAEVMLSRIGAAPGTHSDIDWVDTWKYVVASWPYRKLTPRSKSPEKEEVLKHLGELKNQGRARADANRSDDPAAFKPFAAPFLAQWREVQWRVFQQYWRTRRCSADLFGRSDARAASYLYSKFFLCAAVGLFVGLFVFLLRNATTIADATPSTFFNS